MEVLQTDLDEWIEEYNNKRPHESLGNLTPFEWKMNLIKNREPLLHLPFLLDPVLNCTVKYL